MQYREFIENVRTKSGIDSTAEAVIIVEAVLNTLGERITETEQNDMSAQLPRELQPMLSKWKTHNYYSLPDFYHKVAERAGVSDEQAQKYAQAVGQVIRDAVSFGEMEDVLFELPMEYNELFGGPLRRG